MQNIRRQGGRNIMHSLTLSLPTKVHSDTGLMSDIINKHGSERVKVLYFIKRNKKIFLFTKKDDIL